MARKDSLPGQRYACDRPGCDKNYSRPDHLLRHKLNHDREKVLACDQCDRTFVRQDLLARHLERHAVRGKTLGRWSGRQKSISGEGSSSKDVKMEDDEDDSDEAESSRGNQSYSHNQYYSTHQFDRESEMQSSVRQRNSLPDVSMLPSVDRYETPFAYAPPPQTGSNSTGIPQGYGYRDSIGSGNEGSASNQLGASGSLASYSNNPFSNTGNQPQAASIGPPLPYDALEQQPHQYSHSGSSRSYNYARQSNSRNGGRSTWDMHGPTGQNQSPSAPFNGPNGAGTASWVQNSFIPSNSTMNASDSGSVMNFSAQHANATEQMSNAFAGSLPETTALLHSAVSGSSHFPFSAPTADDYMADYGWLFDGSNPLITGKGADEMASSLSETSTNRETQATDDGHDQNGGEDGQSEDLPYPAQPLEQADALHDLAFFAILQRDIPDEPAFEVDGPTHSRLLHFLSSVPELASSPLFTPSALRGYIYLYFTKLNTIYPLIHRPTFSSKVADPMLLSAMIVNGAHFADEAAHFLAERIGRKLWGAFITFEDFRPARATLALLQAMLLTEAFGKMMGTRPQHETAHLFHNFIVTLARRNAVFVPSKVKLPHTSAEDRWRAWSKEEEKKRISLFAFILDAQHATIFRHIPALSSFQIHLQLPCEEDEWEAKSAEAWTAIRQNKRREPPYFIAALKASLTPGNDLPISESDSFQHFVLLHGLMSVAYDLQWKQQALLAAPDTSESISNWKDRLMQSYKRFMNRYKNIASNRIMERASHSLIEWAQVTLHADAVEIQIYAGLPTVMGRFIDHHTFSVARKSCREWGRTEDARIAVWHAARFLRDTMFPNYGSIGEGQDAAAGAVADRPLHTGFDELLHHQWVQYVCALIIWAYEQAVSPLRGNFANSRPRSQDQESNASSNNTNNVALAGSNTTLQNKNVTNQSVTAQPVPTITTPLDKAIRDANTYLSDIIASDTRSSISFDPPHHYSTAVLELVERDCRGSRWELGREASGVLRKLIRERNAASLPSSVFTSSTG